MLSQSCNLVHKSEARPEIDLRVVGLCVIALLVKKDQSDEGQQTVKLINS